MDVQSYYNLLIGDPSSYEDIAKCLMENGTKEMYHAIVEDGSTAHEHALVQYQKGTHVGYKKELQREKTRFNSKTIFKPILCPDHAVGVL